MEGASQTANGTGIGKRLSGNSARSLLTSVTSAGLALTLETVKALGAELEVVSILGKGTTFLSVTLPWSRMRLTYTF